MIEQISFTQEEKNQWKRWDRTLKTKITRGWVDDEQYEDLVEILAELIYSDGKYVKSGPTISGQKRPIYFREWMPPEYRKEGAVFGRIVSPDEKNKPKVKKQRWNGWDVWKVSCYSYIFYYEDSTGWLVGIEEDGGNDIRILIKSNAGIPKGSHSL